MVPVTRSMVSSRRMVMVALGLGITSAMIGSDPAAAQATWPTKPLRIIIPFAAGGGTDIAARHLQPHLAEILGQPVVIENRGGSAGIVGTEAMVRAPADNHTIGMAVSSLAANPYLYKSLPFDTKKDVKPITILFRATNVWVVHLSAPYKSLAEVIAAAKAAPGKVTVATSGGGTQQHLGLEQMKLMAGVDITSVPYRGAGAALNDLLANQIQIGILNMSSMLGPIRDGRLRGIAVTSGERSQHAPDIPSVSETVAGFDSIEWFAFVAPGTISDDIVARLHAAIVKAAQKPEFQARAKEMGVDLVLNTPSEFATVIAADMARVEDLVKKVDIKVD